MKSFRGNPLASIHLKWSDEMVSDLRKYQDDASTLIPGCWARNITSYEVSIYLIQTQENFLVDKERATQQPCYRKWLTFFRALEDVR